VKKKLFGIFLAVCFLFLGSEAKATSFVSVLATVPDTVFHAVTIGTDTAEYVSGKVAYGFAEIDTVADAGVNFFHALAHPSAAQVAAKAQAKAAKKAAKAAKAKK
jgi:hypothetical protein